MNTCFGLFPACAHTARAARIRHLLCLTRSPSLEACSDANLDLLVIKISFGHIWLNRISMSSTLPPAIQLDAASDTSRVFKMAFSYLSSLPIS